MCNLEDKPCFRLPVRCSPRNDESLLGYVVRLADLNSYDTPTWILRLASMKVANMATGAVLFEENANYDKLAELAWASPEEVKRLSYRATAGKKATAICSFLGTSVQRAALNWMYAKVCPHCLKNDPYIRAVWDLSIATTCPIHRCLLMDNCPQCRQKIPSLRKEVIRCRCGFDLTTISPLQVDEVQLGITKIIWKLCGLQCEQSDESASSPLSKMSLEELYDTLELTSKVASGYDFSSYKKILSITYTNIEIHQLLLRVYRAFFDWPIAFESMLDDRLVAESGNIVGVPNAYSSKMIKALVRLLTIKGSAGQTRRKVETLCAGVANYICRTNGTVKEDWRLAPYADIRNAYLTKNAARKELDLPHDAITQLVKSGIIRTKKFPTGKSFRLLIEPASLHEYKKKYDRSLTSYEVADTLCVSRSHVSRLIKYKTVVPICGPGVCKQMDWRFDQDEIHAIIDKISSQAPESVISMPEKWLTMSRAACLSRCVGILTPDIFQLIIEGECKAIRIRGSKGISGLRISKESLKAICLEKANQKSPNHWTINRIAQTLGIKQMAVRHFIKSGHLRATKINCKNKHGVESNTPYYCISSESFEEFKAEFVLPREVAKKYRLTLRLTSTLLKLSGIVPVSSPKVGVSGLYLFRRAEVEAAGEEFMNSVGAKRRIWLAERYYKKRDKVSWN